MAQNVMDCHQHTCPQCFAIWICARTKCDPAWKRFCPSGDLCHVDDEGNWKVTPETIRKSRGIGKLFETKGVQVVSVYKAGDQGMEATLDTSQTTGL